MAAKPSGRSIMTAVIDRAPSGCKTSPDDATHICCNPTSRPRWSASSVISINGFAIFAESRIRRATATVAALKCSAWGLRPVASATSSSGPKGVSQPSSARRSSAEAVPSHGARSWSASCTKRLIRLAASFGLSPCGACPVFSCRLGLSPLQRVQEPNPRVAVGDDADPRRIQRVLERRLASAGFPPRVGSTALRRGFHHRSTLGWPAITIRIAGDGALPQKRSGFHVFMRGNPPLCVGLASVVAAGKVAEELHLALAAQPMKAKDVEARLRCADDTRYWMSDVIGRLDPAERLALELSETIPLTRLLEMRTTDPITLIDDSIVRVHLLDGPIDLDIDLWARIEQVRSAWRVLSARFGVTPPSDGYMFHDRAGKRITTQRLFTKLAGTDE